MTSEERYINLATLKGEIPFSSSDFILDDEVEDEEGLTEWDNFLLDKLDDESSRVESWFPEQDFGEDTPTTINEGVIRLVRLRLDLINSDGLDSESLVDGASYSYSEPREIRKEIKSEIAEEILAEEDLTDDNKGAWVV